MNDFNGIFLLFQEDSQDAELWMRLLAMFCQFTEPLCFVNLQVAPVVLGCMAVYIDSAVSQQHGCNVLAHVATYQPGVKEKVSFK